MNSDRVASGATAAQPSAPGGVPAVVAGLLTVPGSHRLGEFRTCLSARAVACSRSAPSWPGASGHQAES